MPVLFFFFGFFGGTQGKPTFGEIGVANEALLQPSVTAEALGTPTVQGESLQ